MFWEDPGWRDYPQSGNNKVDAGLEILRTQNSQLDAAMEEFRKQPALSGDAASPEVPPSPELRLSQVRWNLLTFFNEKFGEQPILVELSLRRGDAVQGKLYCCIYRAENSAAGESATCLVEPLSGRSEALRKVSEIYSVQLEQAAAYVDFYCSFYAGGEGPFSIIRKKQDVTWRAAKVFDGVRQQRLLADTVNPGAFDFGADKPLATFEDARREMEARLDKYAGIRPVDHNNSEIAAQLIEEFVNSPEASERTRKKNRAELEEALAATPKPDFRILVVVIQYGRNFFRSALKVFENGAVQMLADVPLHPLTGNLPIDSWAFDEKLNLGKFRFLVHLEYNLPSKNIEQSLNAETLKRTARTDGKTDAPGEYPVLTLGPGSQENKIRCGNRPFPRSLIFSEVDFLEDVTFENAAFLGSVTFERCKFMSRVSFRSARINGSLTFDDCMFVGFPPAEASEKAGPNAGPNEDQPAREQAGWCADLRGALIARSLVFEQCTFEDSVLLSHIRVKGKTRFVGCSIGPLYDARLIKGNIIPLSKRFLDPNQTGAALDLRYGQFSGGVDLTAHYSAGRIDFRPQQKTTRPTVIVGPVRAEHCVIRGGLTLNGVLTCRLNPALFRHTGLRLSWAGVTFAHSDIRGGLRTWSPGEAPLESFHLMRTVIRDGLDLSNCKISGDVDLRGTWIGGDLDAGKLHTSGVFSLASLRQSVLDLRSDFDSLSTLPLAGSKEQLLFDVPPETLIIPAGESRAPRIAAFGRTHVGGNVDLRAARCEALRLDGCCVQGTVSCDGGNFGEISAVLSISALRTGSELNSFFEPGGEEEQNPTLIFEYLKSRQGRSVHFTKVESPPARIAGLAGMLVYNSEFREFRMRDARVRGRLWMVGVLMRVDAASDRSEIWRGDESVEGDIGEQCKAFSARMAAASPAIIPALHIENCTIQGPVLLFDPDFANEFLFRAEDDEREELRTILNGKKTVKSGGAASRVEDDCLLAEKLAGHLASVDRSRIHGDIRIENTLVDGKLFLSNLDVRGAIEVKDLVLQSDFVAGYSRRGASAGATVVTTVVTTEATRLDLEMLNCDGDVILSGLRLTEHLTARNMRVRGNFELCFQEPGRKACSGIIGGTVDLGGSEIGWLQCIASGQGAQSDTSEREWRLEQTKVKRLVFFAPLPLSFNVRGFECRAIDFPVHAGDRGIASLHRTEFFARCEPPLEPIVMTERLLRNEGKIDVANDVFVRHQQQLYSGGMGRLRGSIFTLFVNPRAPVWCLVLLVFAFMGAMLLVFPPENWTPGPQPAGAAMTTTAASAAPVSAAAKVLPAGQKQEAHEQAAMPGPDNLFFLWRAFDIAVPIVSVHSQASGEQSHLKDRGPATLGAWTVGVSPSFAASVFSLLGWMAVSCFFLTASGILKRE